MKTHATRWIIVAACAVWLSVPAIASARHPRESRHPDPHRRPSSSRYHQPNRGYYHRPAPQPYYVYSSAAWAPSPVFYHAPPPPPPVVICPAPAIVYPVRPGLQIVLSF